MVEINAFLLNLLSVLPVNNRLIIYGSFKYFSSGCECIRHSIEDYYSLYSQDYFRINRMYAPSEMMMPHNYQTHLPLCIVIVYL